jgi:hypothetical protein
LIMRNLVRKSFLLALLSGLAGYASNAHAGGLPLDSVKKELAKPSSASVLLWSFLHPNLGRCQGSQPGFNALADGGIAGTSTGIEQADQSGSGAYYFWQGKHLALSPAEQAGGGAGAGSRPVTERGPQPQSSVTSQCAILFLEKARPFREIPKPTKAIGFSFELLRPPRA